MGPPSNCKRFIFCTKFVWYLLFCLLRPLLLWTPQKMEIISSHTTKVREKFYRATRWVTLWTIKISWPQLVPLFLVSKTQYTFVLRCECWLLYFFFFFHTLRKLLGLFFTSFEVFFFFFFSFTHHVCFVGNGSSSNSNCLGFAVLKRNLHSVLLLKTPAFFSSALLLLRIILLYYQLIIIFLGEKTKSRKEKTSFTFFCWAYHTARKNFCRGFVKLQAIYALDSCKIIAYYSGKILLPLLPGSKHQLHLTIFKSVV